MTVKLAKKKEIHRSIGDIEYIFKANFYLFTLGGTMQDYIAYSFSLKRSSIFFNLLRVRQILIGCQHASVMEGMLGTGGVKGKIGFGGWCVE